MTTEIPPRLGTTTDDPFTTMSVGAGPVKFGTTKVDATPAPPSRESPAEEPKGAAEAGGSSPSAVREHEIALTLRHAHLKEQYPKALLEEQRTLRERKAIAAEMVEIERLLRAHKRLREPVKRRKP